MFSRSATSTRFADLGFSRRNGARLQSTEELGALDRASRHGPEDGVGVKSGAAVRILGIHQRLHSIRDERKLFVHAKRTGEPTPIDAGIP